MNPLGSQLAGKAARIVIGDTSVGRELYMQGLSRVFMQDATSGNARYDGFIGYEQTGRFLKFVSISANGKI